MASKTSKKAISDALSDLTKEKMEEFCSTLHDRREEPRIRLNAIEGRTITEITNVLVQTFTEDAIPVTTNILKQIDCNDVAQDLEMVNPRAQVKSDLKSPQDNRDKYKEFEQKYKEVSQRNKKMAVATEKQIRADIEMLHQFLREEEEVRLEALREEEKQKAEIVSRELKNIKEQISLSDNISAAEQELHEPRVQCPVLDPQQVSGVMIDVSKHLGNLTYRVWEKMKEKIKFTPVILDPNTAHHWLCLSEDLTSVRSINNKLQLPVNPERFTATGVVLGSEGFSSGTHSWEVEIGDHPQWHIGVVKDTVERKIGTYNSPECGFWCVHYRGGKYMNGRGKPIPVQRNPQKIRVQLDYDRGEVSFYDTEDMTCICIHEDCILTEKLYPYFFVGLARDAKTTNIRVCQAEISHSVMLN